MEGKLIKTENGYGLKDCELIAFVSSRRPEHKHHKLSLKNCQAIERGFDLDALAEKKYPFDKGYGVYERNCQISDLQDAFLEGFQMRDKMLGDKKFSEEDMLSFESFVSKWYDKATDVEEFRALPSELLIKWESLQQKEWDVEICCYVEEDSDSDSFTSPMLTNTGNPKLDENGCLILKRK